MLTNNALYPWGTSVGKDKHCAVCRAQVHNSNRSPVQSSNMKRMQSCSISLSSNYIRSSFLLDLLWYCENTTNCIPQFESRWLMVWNMHAIFCYCRTSMEYSQLLLSCHHQPLLCKGWHHLYRGRSEYRIKKWIGMHVQWSQLAQWPGDLGSYSLLWRS